MHSRQSSLWARRRMKSLFALFAMIIALAPLRSEAKAIRHLEVAEGWDVNAYSNDATGQFSHCAASAPYKSGSVLFVSVTNTFDWQLAFLNPNWSLIKGSKRTIFIKVDNAKWKNYTAEALDTNFVVVNMPATDHEMINFFRFGRGMEVTFDSVDISFELTGTSRLVRGLAECVTDQIKSSTAVATEKSNSSGGSSGSDPKGSPDKADEATGTGIIVNPSGLILTNNHVAGECKSITITREGELTQSATLLRADKTNDLAIVKAGQTFASDSVAKFRTSPPVRAGEQVAVYGFPLTGMLSISGNVVAGNISSLAGIQDDVRFYQTSAPVQPGNSGGPLLDYAGNVVGVVTAKIDDFLVAGATGSIPQNVNFAIKSQIATSFMDAHGIDYRSAPSSNMGSLSTVVDAAKKFTVLIDCKR